MKKFISVILLLTLCLGLFAGCDNKPAETQPAVDNLASAKSYLFNMYKGSAGKGEANKVAKDFSVVTAVAIDGESFPVEWAVTVTAGAADAVQIADGENGAKVIDIVEQPEEQVDFTLTGTVKGADGKTESVSFLYYVAAVPKAPETSELTAVDAPETGKPYKLGMFQGNLAQSLYITGNTANKEYYLETVEDGTAAIDVYLEAAEGGYYIYFTKDGAKTYIDIYQSGDYVNIRLVAEPAAVFVWNTEYKTLTTNVAGEDYYMGTYKEYNTVSASKLSYAATSFPSNLYAGKSVSATAVETPAAGTAYKFGMLQGNLSKNLYMTGNTANKEYYLETTENVDEAIDVFLEETEGGYYIYFTKDGVKTYIDIYQSGDYVNIRLVAEPAAVFVWNTEYKTLTTNVAEEGYYMGTYKEYNTLSASKLSYAATSFPATLYTVG